MGFQGLSIWEKRGRESSSALPVQEVNRVATIAEQSRALLSDINDCVNEPWGRELLMTPHGIYTLVSIPPNECGLGWITCF